MIMLGGLVFVVIEVYYVFVVVVVVLVVVFVVLVWFICVEVCYGSEVLVFLDFFCVCVFCGVIVVMVGMMFGMYGVFFLLLFMW